MARVLCAWEFGSDLGHLRELMTVARELRAIGHAVTFAFRDSSRLALVHAEGFEAFLAPLLRAPPVQSSGPLNFSEILLNLGFDDRAGLLGALRAWRSFLEMVEPDIVVADYAPVCLMAARVAGVRRVTLGSGFSVPPLDDPMPALRPWAYAEPGVLRALDDRVMNSVRAAMNGAANAPRIAADLFEAHAHLLVTFAELDPFAGRDTGEYLGPTGDAAFGVDVEWTGSGQRVFAYVKPRSARFAAVLQGLRDIDAEVIVAAPGLEPALARDASNGSMRVIPGPVNLDGVLREASLCVSHAGPGVAARALVAGVPMALLPLQLEQFLVAKRLKDAGLAELVAPDEQPPEFVAWFRALLAREDMPAAARRQALRFKGFSFAAAARRSAERIAELAAQ